MFLTVLRQGGKEEKERTGYKATIGMIQKRSMANRVISVARAYCGGCGKPVRPDDDKSE